MSEATAKRLWPGEDPLGKRVFFGKPPLPGRRFESEPYSPASDVIGIAKHVRSVQLYEVDQALLYLPLPPTNDIHVWLMVRTTNDPSLLIPRVRQEIENVDRAAFPRAYTLDSALNEQRLPTRALSVIGGVLGVLGLILASLGLGGVVAYSVASRTREIGIRIWLGATSGNIIRLILNRITILIAVGVVLEITGATILSKFLVSLLYGISPFDPLAFGLASGFLVAVALLAAFIPARAAPRASIR